MIIVYLKLLQILILLLSVDYKKNLPGPVDSSMTSSYVQCHSHLVCGLFAFSPDSGGFGSEFVEIRCHLVHEDGLQTLIFNSAV